MWQLLIAAQGKRPEDFDFGKVATGAAYGHGIGQADSRVLKGASKAGELITKQEDKFLRGEFSDPGKINTLNRVVTRALSAFRYRSFLPGDMARMKSLVNPAIDDIKSRKTLEG